MAHEATLTIQKKYNTTSTSLLQNTPAGLPGGRVTANWWMVGCRSSIDPPLFLFDLLTLQCSQRSFHYSSGELVDRWQLVRLRSSRVLALQEARFQKRCGVRRCELLLSCTKVLLGVVQRQRWSEMSGVFRDITNYKQMFKVVQRCLEAYGGVRRRCYVMFTGFQRCSELFRVVLRCSEMFRCPQTLRGGQRCSEIFKGLQWHTEALRAAYRGWRRIWFTFLLVSKLFALMSPSREGSWSQVFLFDGSEDRG